LGATVVPVPPPASFSPFRGKSSSYTNTESFAGGSGVGCTNTVTGARVPVHVVAGGTGVQAAGIGAPPMPWPGLALAVWNGMAASPDRIEM